MTRRPLVALALIAVMAAISGCTHTPKETPMPSTLADAKSQARSHLDTIVDALTNAGHSARHDNGTAQLGPSPCGENGPDFQITAVDHVTVPAELHRTVLTGARTALEHARFAVTASRDLPGTTGGELNLRHTDGYTATITSSSDGIWLAIILTSPCLHTPDGTYPR